MNILAIETTGAEASVAVINDKGEVFMETSDQKMNQLQNLMPMVDILLMKCGMSIDDVDYIAVSEGPGSFTGIRIGVSSARALAQALDRKNHQRTYAAYPSYTMRPIIRASSVRFLMQGEARYTEGLIDGPAMADSSRLSPGRLMICMKCWSCSQRPFRRIRRLPFSEMGSYRIGSKS